MKTSIPETQADRLLLAHLLDLAERSSRDCIMYCSRFLDERQVFLAQQWLSGRSDCQVRLWGGYDDAQRKICCVYPEWMLPEDAEPPLVCLTFRYRETDSLTHRDFLGAFMSCGIQRETIGDIVIAAGKAQAIVTEAVAPLLRELTKIGRFGVKVTDDVPFAMQTAQNFREISGTVASLRIDAVAALAIRESREKTVRLLQQDRITVNYSQAASPSLMLSEGDLFSVRGYGKFRLKSVTGLSKKGRLHILIEQFH
ncbi:MAG: RNA-binding protein [Ruminococcus sp.]|nr:RNA-binding protein [Ruminococcus sp.]